MIAGNCLLDTNAVIAMFAGESKLFDLLTQYENYYVSVISVGELNYGVQKSTNKEQNQQRIQWLQENYPILDCDVKTARIYGDLKQQLKMKGKPIPENDVWIAAHALQHQLALISTDAHFQTIQQLAVKVW